MNPELKQIDADQSSISGVDEIKVEVNGDEAATITPYETASEANEQWRKIGERVSSFLSDLPDYLGDFFNEYKRPLTTIGLVLGAFIAVKITLAILDSLDDIPLLSPTFQLIGIAYSAWFIYRYLWQASNRKELGDNLNSIRRSIFGGSTEA